MEDMESPAVTPPISRLSAIGQLYVTTVGAVAFLSQATNSEGWQIALVVLSLPLSLLALWVGYYAGVSVAFVTGVHPGDFSWPDAPESWQRSLRELAVTLEADWPALGLAH